MVESIRLTSPKELSSPSLWWKLFQSADRIVNLDTESGFTSLAGFCVSGGYVYGSSCGDSAAYLCNCQAQVIELTANQLKNPQIGSGTTSSTFFSAQLVKPWMLLFMTDGVWKYVGRDKITKLLQSMDSDSLGQELISGGRLPGSGKFSDDFSFFLIESK